MLLLQMKASSFGRTISIALPNSLRVILMTVLLRGKLQGLSIGSFVNNDENFREFELGYLF